MEVTIAARYADTGLQASEVDGDGGLPVDLPSEGAARVACRPLAATLWRYLKRLVRINC